MTQISRRRFLAMTAVLPLAGRASASTPVARFRGAALGSAASLTLAHPEADRIATRVWAEVERLENVFSLYKPESSLSRLNAAGALEGPPF